MLFWRHIAQLKYCLVYIHLYILEEATPGSGLGGGDSHWNVQSQQSYFTPKPHLMSYSQTRTWYIACKDFPEYMSVKPLLSKFFILLLVNPPIQKKKKIPFFNIAYWPESSEIVYSCWLIKETKLTTLMSIIKCVKLTNGNNKETCFFFCLLVMLWHQFVLNNESGNLEDLLFIMVQN